MKKICKKWLAAFLGALLLFTAAGCTKKEEAPNEKPAEPSVIKIATKPMTEQFILSEMLALLIEQETGCTVEITKGIGGGTSNIHPALVKGEFDLYPEYTATGWLMVLKKTELPEETKLMAELKKEYEEQYGLTWVGEYGFNNTYTLAVRKEAADEYQLNTYSDLAKVADKLIFGGNADFVEREDGFIGLCETYGFTFKDTVDIDIGLKYQALASKEIDLTNAYTTDAQLSVADVKTLEDDKHYFTNYYASTVVRQDALEKYPGLEDALNKMNGILTDQEMAKLNYEVEVNQRDEKDVAREYLDAKGLLNKE